MLSVLHRKEKVSFEFKLKNNTANVGKSAQWINRQKQKLVNEKPSQIKPDKVFWKMSHKDNTLLVSHASSPILHRDTHA